MSNSGDTVQKLIQYYKQCYQASFQTTQGEGIFSEKDIVPLHVTEITEGTLPQKEIIEELFRQWLLDREKYYLVRFSGFLLYPTPNEAGSTDSHYIPCTVVDFFEEILSQQKAAGSVDEPEMCSGINLPETVASAPPLNDMFPSEPDQPLSAFELLEVDDIPTHQKAGETLSHLSKSVKVPSRVNLSVYALVPRDYQPVEYKQGLMQHLDIIAQEHASPTSLLSNLLRRTDLFQYRTSRVELARSKALIHSLPFLSDKQNQVLAAALDHPISCVQGPPGTGKSFTLAALASVLASSGKTVLIATHSDHALSVIRHKLINDLGIDGDFIAHFGNGRRNGQFAEQLRRLFKADGRFNSQTREMAEAFSKLNSDIERQTNVLKDLIQKAPVFKDNVFHARPTFTNTLKHFFLRLKYGSQPQIAQKVVELREHLQQCQQRLGQKTNAVLAAKFSQAYRRDKLAWGTACQQIAKTSVQAAITDAQNKHSKEFEPQQGLSLWLMSLENIIQNTHGRFDYLLVDEATQVNLASTLPALNTADNLIVFGDLKQLRHYSFLSTEQEKRIADRLALPDGSYSSFRATSFLDYIDNYLAQTGQMEAATLLDEHYRSAPPLMQFNSDQFYEGNVQVLTGFSSKNALHALHLEWQAVQGICQDKTNPQEAEALIAYLENLITKEQSQSNKTSIGVLSFFSAQAEYLKKTLLMRLSTEAIRQHKIKIGTPFSFQGEERDHMLISCTVDDDVHQGTWNYLNKPDVFNVATSRARRMQTLFLSVSPAKLPSTSLLRQYHSFSQPQGASLRKTEPQAWLTQLTERLIQAGFSVEREHKIADIDIDLILESEGQMLAVDLIGFPGDVGEAVHVLRYKALFRAGIPLYPLLAIEWLLHREACVAELQNWTTQTQNRLSYSIEHLSSVVKPLETQTIDQLEVLLLPEHLVLLYQMLDAPELTNAGEFNMSSQVIVLNNISQLLAQMFDVTSLTYRRYQASVNAALKKYLENLSTFQMLYNQVWETAGSDHSYWNTLIQPIRERHQAITESLIKLQTELQKQIANAGNQDLLVLDDLDDLAERLKQY